MQPSTPYLLLKPIRNIVVSGGSVPTFAATGNPVWQNLGFGSSTATFSSVNFNTGLAVVGVLWDQGFALTGVTIGGVSATQAIVDATPSIAIYYAAVTGPTANVVVSGASTFNKIGMVAATLTNVTATPTSSAKVDYGSSDTPISCTVTNPATGFGIVVGGSLGGTPTATWSNVVGNAADFTTNNSTTQQIMLAHISASGSRTPTFAAAGYAFAASMAASCWGP